MDSTSTESQALRWTLLLLGITVLYTVGYFAWYGGTVLGQTPVLDGKELLHLARSIARGELSGTPFFRAPLYPAALAALLKFGVPFPSLLTAARCLNGLCHVVSTMLVFCTARRLWQRPGAAMLAGLLYGLNPVAVYFAADPFDISMGVTWLLFGMYFAVAYLQSTPGRARDVFLTGLFWSLGAITRPQLMLVAAAWPPIAFLHAGRDRWRHAAAALAALGIVFGAVGAVNWSLSGKYVVVPTCASYQLYVANKEGVNGRYYTQTLDFKNDQPDANPVMLEAETLYSQESGQPLPVDYDAMNRYWHAKFLQRVTDHPVSWIRLMAWKTYYALNGYEQYNNKTYALQRDLSPWLRLNPINWSVVLLLAAGGLVVGIRRAPVRWIFFVASLYMAGLILFLVSDRYRLPAVPVLAVLAGGWLCDDRKPWPALAAVLSAVGVLTLTSFGHARDPSTYVEDYILMGRAALVVGADDQAETFAENAAALAPDRIEPKEILAVTRYNLLLAGLPGLPDHVDLEQRYARCLALRTYTDKMVYIAGVYAWLLGKGDEAVASWQQLVDRSSVDQEQALAALLMVNRLRAADEDQIHRMEAASANPLLLLAKAAHGDESAINALSPRMTSADLHAQVVALQALFQPPPRASP